MLCSVFWHTAYQTNRKASTDRHAQADRYTQTAHAGSCKHLPVAAAELLTAADDAVAFAAATGKLDRPNGGADAAGEEAAGAAPKAAVLEPASVFC